MSESFKELSKNKLNTDEYTQCTRSSTQASLCNDQERLVTTGRRSFRTLVFSVTLVLYGHVGLHLFGSPSVTLEDILSVNGTRCQIVSEAESLSSNLLSDPWKSGPSERGNASKHTPPKLIRLLGERNSGTSYLEDILKTAFFPRYARNRTGTQQQHPHDLRHPFSADVDNPMLGFKHMFRHAELSHAELETLKTDYPDTLWVLIVRSPCAWADAMYRSPWHMCNPPGVDNEYGRCPGPRIKKNSQALENTTRNDFFQMPWGDWAESESEPNNYTYDNVFALRRHKLRIMWQLIQAVGPHRVKVLHLQSFEAVPGLLVQDLVKQFGLQVATDYKEPLQSDKLHSSLCLEDKEVEIAEQEVDWELESRFGFTRFHCQSCIAG